MNKTIKFFSILAISLALISCSNKNKQQVTSVDKSISKIEVLDFHSTHRCMTCNAIEANTKYTLNTYFSKELKDNKIIFLVINVDEKENEKKIFNKFIYDLCSCLGVMSGPFKHMSETAIAKSWP